MIFDNASLAEAEAEFNRYGARQLAIEGPAARKLRVGGVFRIGDPYSFAQSMADTYHLRIIIRDKMIILTDRQSDSK
jgi:transmembrane sensor